MGIHRNRIALSLLKLQIKFHLLALQLDVLSRRTDLRALINTRNSVRTLRERNNLLKVLCAHRLKEGKIPTVNPKLLPEELQERLVRVRCQVGLQLTVTLLPEAHHNHRKQYPYATHNRKNCFGVNHFLSLPLSPSDSHTARAPLCAYRIGWQLSIMFYDDVLRTLHNGIRGHGAAHRGERIYHRVFPDNGTRV